MAVKRQTYVSKIVNVLKRNDIEVSSFSEPDEEIDGEIDLIIPQRDVHIQIAEYDPEHGLIINEIVNTGSRTLLRTLRVFRLSERGILKMISFIKELGGR